MFVCLFSVGSQIESVEAHAVLDQSNCRDEEYQTIEHAAASEPAENEHHQVSSASIKRINSCNCHRRMLRLMHIPSTFVMR